MSNNITNIIIILVLIGITAAITTYLVRERKKGVQCIGCPYARECAKRKSGRNCGGTSGSNKTNG